MNVAKREALRMTATPFGEVGIVHEGSDLNAWWIWKDAEEVEPTLSAISSEDFILVLRGCLRLEVSGRETATLQAGECAVIPPATPFRGYRWPRDGEPCLFVAVAPASAQFSRASDG